MSDDKVAEALSRYPGPVTLYPSRKKWLFLFGVCALFGAGGFAMVRDGEPTGWFVLGLFGLAAIIPLVVLTPGSNRLTLAADGFEYKTLFISRRVRWSDTDSFGVARIPPANTALVVYDDAAVKDKRSAALNARLTGRTSLLGDSYGLTVAGLASLMAQWRERALGQSGPR